MSVEHLAPPKTIEEVGIHLMYMSKTLSEMQKALEASQANHVPISSFLEYKEIMGKKIVVLEQETAAVKAFISSWTGRVWGINSTIAVVVTALAFYLNHFWTNK